MIDQIVIMTAGAGAIWLSQDADVKFRRWAPVLGLVSQPFWFYTTYANGQWGIFLISFVYAFAWFKGLRYYWLKKGEIR